MGDRWQRLGLILNPAAGPDGAESLRLARTAVERFGAIHVSTGPALCGAAALEGWSGHVTTTTSLDATSRASHSRAVARWLVGQALDAVIVIGGDGTLSDVALEVGDRLPIVGIGAGSTNVGRLVTCRAADVASLDIDALERRHVDGLLASVDDRLVGIAFNDVVIGNTIVGTIAGARCDLDAVERMHGRSVPAVPRSIGGAGARVTRVARNDVSTVAEGDSVATVVAGFAEPAFFGKAVTGGICLASLTGLLAGCVVADAPLARIGVGPDDLEMAPPMISRYVSLSDAVSILVEGIGGDAVLCVDGNPTHHLAPHDRVSIIARRHAAVGVRIRHDTRSA